MRTSSSSYSSSIPARRLEATGGGAARLGVEDTVIEVLQQPP